MERELLADGLSSSIRGLRKDSSEMALRLAGVLAAVDGEGQIRPALLDRGIALARHLLSEAGRLYAATATKRAIQKATKLLHWLVDRNEASTPIRHILQAGPNPLRDLPTLNEVIGVLIAHHLVRVDSNG